MADVIRFYGVGDSYGELSNFAPYPIVLDGKRWPTTEHYFQAQKMVSARDREAIRKAQKPELAARMGRDRAKKIRRDWASVRVGVMRRAVEAKFEQHADLRELLLGTGDAKLVEHAPDDDFWGDGGDGSGQNMLGQILMQVRSEARLTRLFDRLEACEPGSTPGALAWSVGQARHLLAHGEPYVALEHLFSNLGEGGVVVSIAPDLYEEVAAIARAYRMPEREHSHLRRLVPRAGT